jgi:hypothetical protein
MSEDYRIEKVRHSVEVTLRSGQQIHGDIFLQAFARFKAGPELPADVLNDDDEFLPVVLENGDLLVIQKSHIAVVVTEIPESDDPTETGLIGMLVDVTLVDGHSRSGSVFPELRADRPRLVDFLNDTPLRFLSVFAADHLLLVNRAHIAFARPVY